MKKKIAIIGTGIGGLTAGYELLKKGCGVTFFEKEKVLGGLAAGFQIEGTILDQSYRHIFKTDESLIDLIKELGLKNKLKWYRSSTGLYWDKNFYPFSSAIDLLKFKPLNLIDKFRMGLTALWLKYDKNWQKYESVLAYKWMKKWVGERSYKVVWEPLLKGKFDNVYKKVSMAWLWARINTRGNSVDESGKEVLGYLDGGFQTLVDKLVEKTKKKGAIIKSGTEVNCLRKLRKEFDLIIDTRPDNKVDYLGVVTIIFSSEQNLSKYYWNNINDPKSPFLAFIQHTNLVGKEKYNNKNIYYMGVYLPQKSKYFKMDNKKIENEWLTYLKKIFPDFDREKIREIKTFKFKDAQHIVDLNYKVPKYRINSKTYKLNFAQIYPQDRGMNYAVKEARKMVKNI